MSAQALSVTAVVIGAVAVLGSVAFLLYRALRINARLERMSSSPSMVAATRLPALGERIAIGIERLQATGDRFDGIVERLTAAHDASERLRESIASVSACVVGLLDVFTPSQRGRAS
jgi:hypothetical protein